jgi:hypothetical protein
VESTNATSCPQRFSNLEDFPLHSAIAYIAPADKLAGRAEAIWATRREKLAQADARRRTKTKETEFAQPPSAQLQ